MEAGATSNMSATAQKFEMKSDMKTQINMETQIDIETKTIQADMTCMITGDFKNWIILHLFFHPTRISIEYP